MPDAIPASTDQHAYAAALLAQREAVRRRKRRLARRRAKAAEAPDGPGHAIPAPRRSPAQQRGDAAEAAALDLLRGAGLALLARNLACRAGELDLVMREGDVLVFVEVRARGSARYGGAAASVGKDKQRRLRRAAAHFLPGLARRHWGGRTPRCRFDVVAWEEHAPVWLRDAFGGD